MYVRVLRKDKRLSQEQLAESSGLSLRTVQRVEGGHRVSYASMRALAGALEVDVDKLELELFAMDNTAAEYREMPLWVRLLVGRGGLSVGRRELLNAEIILVLLGTALGALWAANMIWPLVYDRNGDVLRTSLTMFFFRLPGVGVCPNWGQVLMGDSCG